MAESPKNVDASLEYITVEAYKWPQPEPAQRFRLTEEERKRRHREDQRRFMERKLARLEMLREEATLRELQLSYLWVLQEIQMLTKERWRLEQARTEQEFCKSEVQPVLSSERPAKDEQGDFDRLLSEVLLSL